MLAPHSIVETFDIEREHIRLPNMIWNKTLGQWVQTSSELVAMLLALIKARVALRTYAQYLYNPMSDDSRKVYYALLDRVACCAVPLYKSKANIFCMLHKGYSLN